MNIDEVRKIFKNHWEYYSKQGAGILDTIHNLQGKIAQEYSGRVIYELLQNAFDPAENHVIIDIFVHDNYKYLIVANDGDYFSFQSNFDYDKKEPKNNFNSLCSIADSNKKFSSSIGNKGIGFRSVFQVNDKMEEKVAYILTKPYINKQQINTKEVIGFKLYETAIYSEICKNEFYELIIQNNNNQIDLLNSNRLCGFCYPILLATDEIKKFEEYFQSDIRTIIIVPLYTTSYENKISKYIEQVKKIHFYFVSLKYDIKDIKVSICKQEPKIINSSKYLTFSSINKNKELNELTQNLHLIDENNELHIKVACYYHTSDEVNYIYNYLPTEMKSPFRCMDIHSDFLTSLNRESMNLKEAEDEGKYNLILLRACIELHFLIFVKYLDNSSVKLNLELIDENNIPKIKLNKDNFWKYIQLNDSTIKQQTIDIINKIFKKEKEDKPFENFYSFISKLAFKYFNESDYEITLENINDFWKVIFDYFDLWREDKGSSIFAINWIRERFNDAVIKPFEKIKCIPITIKNNDKEELKSIKSFNDIVFYKESNNNTNISIPSNLNISITEYSFFNNAYSLATEPQFKDLQFKKFTNYNEILKHFRQTSKSGDIGDAKIEEKEQKDILKTVFEIYLAKMESNFVSTHRYIEVLSDKTNKDYTKIAADFSVSTLFLKIGNNKYKPSQYCHIEEVDKVFLDFEIPKEKKDKKSIDDFLKFLGVSFDKNIKYIDYDNKVFFEGLDYIPSLITNIDVKEEFSKISYIPNMKIQYNGDLKHPSLFYKTSIYNGILQEIKSKETDKDSLSIVVKKLEYYPEKYIDILVNSQSKIQNLDCDVVFKFYNEIFKKYSEKYLIYTTDGKIEWIKELDKTIYIAKTKEDFDLLKNKTNILATFSDVKDSDKLKKFQANIEKSIVNMDGEDKKSIKQQLDILVPYILLSISKSDKESRKDFLEDEQSNLQSYFQKWQELEFKQLDKIELKIKIVGKEEEIKPTELSEPILIDKIVYYKEENELYEFATIMADFFTVGKLQTNIENILLKGEKVRDSFDKREIEQISSKWINIDDKTKENIIKEITKIGFKDDIGFKLSYFKSDLKKCEDESPKITQNELQRKINEINKPEKLNITFNCVEENKKMINKVLEKYKLIELSIDNIQKAQLIQKVYLKDEDIFDIFEKTEEQLDEELERLTRENLKDTYKLIQIPKESGKQSSSTEISESTTNVDNFFTNHHSARNIKIAQNRGLKIEEDLVKILAEDLKLSDWQVSIKEIFEEIKNQKLVDGTTPRYNLRNQGRYEELLENKNTKLSDLFHMSKILGDGLGFDILYPNIENNGNKTLFKVEVKSSFDGKSIYLSENERKQILLSKDDKKFKIYLYIREKEPLDITEIVRNVLLIPNDFSNITAETWIINL